MEPIQILLADDHPVFRRGIRALLGIEPDLAIVGEATLGEQAVELAAALQPDVVLMDIQMPGINGIEATRRILHTSPHIRILMVTMYEDDEWVFMALRAGALGYVLKHADEADILRAIRAVARGEAIFSPAVARRVIDYFAAPRPILPPQVFPELTEREREILGLIARGESNGAIAALLFLSPKTVANHVSNIFGKLQVADRAHVIIRAREAGLGR